MLKVDEDGWAEVRDAAGNTGMAPVSYLQMNAPPPPPPKSPAKPPPPPPKAKPAPPPPRQESFGDPGAARAATAGAQATHAVAAAGARDGLKKVETRVAQPPPPAPTHGGAFGDVVEPSVNPEEAAKESYTAVSLWKQGFRQGMGNDDLGAAFANAKGGEVQPPPPSLDLEGNAFAATKVATAQSRVGVVPGNHNVE